MKVASIPFKKIMGFHVQEHVKVPGGSPIQTGLTLAPQPQSGAFVHPRGDFDRNHLFLFHPAVPMAFRAGGAGHLPLAPTSGASPGNRKKTLGGSDLPRPFASRTYHPPRSGLGSGTMA